MLTEAGKLEYAELRCVRLQKSGKPGAFRMHGQYQLPDFLGGGLVTVALYDTEEDRRRGLKRMEYLRPIPPSNPDYPHLYARRKDVESVNRALEDSLYLKKAHSLGRVAQQADMIGFGLMTNVVTAFRHRQRMRLEAAA